jgi:hypothetical protein
VPTFAQDATTRWLVVTQVAAGKVVRVQLNSGRTFSGKLIRGSESGLVLQVSKGETMLAREEIREIRVREGRGRGGRAKLGAIIGGSIGGGLGAAAGAGLGSAEVAVAATVESAGIGAAIGAAIPDRYTTVYTAPTAGPLSQRRDIAPVRSRPDRSLLSKIRNDNPDYFEEGDSR